MTPQQNDQERLMELSIGEVLGDLSVEEQREYAELRMRHPEFDPSPSERAVAAAITAAAGRGEPMPEDVAAALIENGERFLAGQETSRPAVRGPAVRGPAVRRPSWPARNLGWLALAASILVAVGVWMTNGPELPRSAAEQRAQLLASGHTLVRSSWSAGPDATGSAVQGDVVWDPQTQTGFMRFIGLRPNARSQEQYQLWIFDADRDERYPVDGGVFDVAGQGEVIVPIDARLRIARPTLFAVTVEKPGGVVVSSRERIAALAKTG